MKNVVAFAASSSSTSINKTLVKYTSHLMEDSANVTVIDIENFPMPIYSEDVEREDGLPEQAVAFRKIIDEADGICISFAEHNGSYTVAFKNAFDWASRVAPKIWGGKVLLLMATSPGPRGGASVLAAATERFPFMGGTVAATYSLPSFAEHMDAQGNMLPGEHQDRLQKAVDGFLEVLNAL